MTIKSVVIAPPYSIIVVNDPNNKEVPKWHGDPPIVSTESCIVVLCRAEVDGPTEILLGDLTEVNPGHPPQFEGTLKTPSRRIVVETAEGETVLEALTARSDTQVSIWLNRARRPNRVAIGIAPALGASGR